MSAGILKSITFTPQSDGTLIVTVTGEAQGTSGGDWGASIFVRAFADQGTPSYGDQIRVSSTTRLPFALQHQIAVTGGVSCTAGLYGDISGAVALTAWDVKVQAEIIKR